MPVPKWRNWQTRMVQVHVLARVWRFKSSLRHQEAAKIPCPGPATPNRALLRLGSCPASCAASLKRGIYTEICMATHLDKILETTRSTVAAFRALVSVEELEA